MARPSPLRHPRLPRLSLRSNKHSWKIGLVPLLMLWVLFCVIVLSELSSVIHHPSDEFRKTTISIPSPSNSVFKGAPWTSPLLKDRTVLHETAFARCEIHSVYSEDRKEVSFGTVYFIHGSFILTRRFAPLLRHRSSPTGCGLMRSTTST